MNPFEPYYEIISNIYLVCITLFNAYCYVLWVRPSMPEPECHKSLFRGSGQEPGDRKLFFRRAGQKPGHHKLLYRDAGREQEYCGGGIRDRIGRCGTLWKVGAAYAVVMIILQLMPFYISNVLAYGLGTLAAFLVMCLADRQNFGQKVFLAVTFFCIRWQSQSVVTNIRNLLSTWELSFILSTRDHESLSFLYTLAMESYEFWFYNFIVETIIEFIVRMAVMYGAVRLMLRVYCGGQEYMKGKELLLLVTPSVSGALAYGVIQFFILAYESETPKSVYDLPGYCLLMALYSLISYTAILVSVYVFRKWKQEQEADGQRRVFMMQMKDMQSHIMEVERLYSDMRRFRHDMGNHLMTLEELYGRREYEAAGRYAEALKTGIQDTSPDVKSGNPVTDAVLSGWKKKMEEQGIAFTCGFHYPQRGKADAFDISIILNNALSNAVEAARQEECREVFLSVHRMKNMYVIEVRNTFSGELKIDRQSGLPVTTKAEDGHGFGLASIRHAAQKYYGDIEIGTEENEGRRYCVLRVMLQIMTDNSGD